MKRIIFTALVRLIQVSASVASIKLLTHFLSPLDVGLYSLVGSIIGFVTIFLISPVGIFINRKINLWVGADVFEERFNVFIVYLCFQSLISFVVVFVTLRIGSQYLDISMGIALLVAGNVLFAAVAQTLIPSLNLLGRFRSYSIFAVVQSISVALFPVISISIWAPSAMAWLFGMLFSQVVFSIISYSFYKKSNIFISKMRLPSKFNWVDVKAAWQFCWPLSVTAGLGWLHIQGYRFYLAEYFGLDKFGLFAAGYTVAAGLMSALEQFLNTWLYPGFYRNASSSDINIKNSAWSDYILLMIPASFLSMCVIISISNDLTWLMLGPRFRDTGEYLIVGAVVEWTRININAFSLLSHLKEKTGELILPGVVSIVLVFMIILLLDKHEMLLSTPIVVAGAGWISIFVMYCINRNSEYVINVKWKSLIFMILLCLMVLAAVFCLRFFLKAYVNSRHFSLLFYSGLTWLFFFFVYLKFKSKIAYA